ncbi:MAG: type I restriction-modification system endonuclease [Blastocatellia bacterium]
MSVNFDFLSLCSKSLVEVVELAENYFVSDPNTCIFKLRQFGEQLCHYITAQIGIPTNPRDDFKDLIDILQNRRALDSQAVDILHRLRKAGNVAAHQLTGDSVTALGHLRMAHQLAIAVYRAFGKDPSFKPSAFIPPPDPDKKNKELTKQIDLLNQQLKASLTATEDQAHKLSEAEQKALAYQMDLSQAQAKAKEVEELLETERKKLAELETQSAKSTEFEIRQRIKKIYEASEKIELDELQTRLLIDKQLMDAGWEANTVTLKYKEGVRPQVGRNMAIAEWPVEKGFADYVLFVGLKAVAVVEAKRESIDVYNAIEQSKRYSKTYEIRDNEILPAGPWGDYKVPFLFATNGRPYLRQLETKSGIWFQDIRNPKNRSRALTGWYSPDGLIDLLKQDLDAANNSLASSSLDYLPLYDYQRTAVSKVEEALAREERKILIAMATGTGKTRTAICLIYRLIKAQRFRRILFLVDREALGVQASDNIETVAIEDFKPFAKIYDFKGISKIEPERDTRLQVATVQSLVRRILYTSDQRNPLPVDLYDCIIVDECHRGYTLDKEMTDAELTFRDQDDYISKYRRVLDHFDAVKIGLTATPALHTTEIFGMPVYQYSYREAVIDGRLVDHEPIMKFKTDLAEKGIKWESGDSVKIVNTKGEQALVTLEDEVKMDLEHFNSQVITENFNRVVCEELTKYIDPTLEEKTLVFCVTDFHADIVVKILKEVYPDAEDDAILKITGNPSVDRPLEKIKRFKNERLPNIVVTVDLLTTGIDVPQITNLVFLRRVKSRILYEQMLGRATRLCPEIKKEKFRVFDAVKIYEILEDFTSMKPVVANPKIAFGQLISELTQLKDPTARKQVLEQLIIKLQNKQKLLSKEKLENFQILAEITPTQLIQSLKICLKTEDFDSAASWFTNHKEIENFLDTQTKTETKMYISDHADKIIAVEQDFGEAEKPEDYLESFEKFIKENINLIPALLVVTQKPRDLTRQQLKELKTKLGDKYSETKLETAWRKTTNQDIAASIIGFIRNKALGSPLIPYEERVDRAIRKIMSSHSWTDRQRKLLESIAKQIKKETVIDREYFDQVPAFQNQGGYKQINKNLDGQLDQVLSDIYDALWQDSA